MISEMKIEFSQRFYTFKSSDKTAVIPIKRHITRGYASLNWNARWCARHDDDTTSSESEDEGVSRCWSVGWIICWPDFTHIVSPSRMWKQKQKPGVYSFIFDESRSLL